LEVLIESILECFLNFGGRREVGKIVYVNAEVNRRLALNEDTREYTGVMGTGCKATLGHSVTELVEPVFGAATETIKGLAKEPEFIGRTKGAARGWTDNNGLVGRKKWVAKGILAITLLLGAAHFDGHGSEESVTLFSDNGGIFLAFGPRSFFIVSEDNDATFRTNGIPKFVWFDGLNDHGGKNGYVGVLGEPDGFSDGVIGAMVNECGVFFNIRLGPDGLIDVGFVHGLAERIGDTALELTSRDVESTGRGRPS
jgi:hypothetical protein